MACLSLDRENKVRDRFLSMYQTVLSPCFKFCREKPSLGTCLSSEIRKPVPAPVSLDRTCPRQARKQTCIWRVLNEQKGILAIQEP